VPCFRRLVTCNPAVDRPKKDRACDDLRDVRLPRSRRPSVFVRKVPSQFRLSPSACEKAFGRPNPAIKKRSSAFHATQIVAPLGISSLHRDGPAGATQQTKSKRKKAASGRSRAIPCRPRAKKRCMTHIKIAKFS
jgi:hypothetical protein